MLSELLQTVGKKARAVADGQPFPGTGAAMDHAREVATGLLPRAEQGRLQVAAFANDASAEVRSALATRDPATMRATFERLLIRLSAVRGCVDAIASEANGKRAQLGSDVTDLDVRISAMGQQVIVLQNQAAAVSQRIEDQKLRTGLTWGFGVICPLVKIIDEIVSLAQDGTLTEAQLGNLIGQLERLRADIDRANVTQTMLIGLRDAATDLTGGMQSLANDIAITAGELISARDDLAEGDAATVELCGQTALLDLDRLRADAA